jgi:phosphoribosylaminoimidazole-succinocarboxamide synthase
MKGMVLLDASTLADLPAPRRGKVREVFDLGDQLLIVASDRISAFDVVMANGIPDKGRILNQMSLFWFERLRNVCPNHLIAADDEAIRAISPRNFDALRGRSVIAKKAQPLAIECVVRGFITGSLLKEYRAQGGAVHGLQLPEGLVDGDRLPEPIFTPATKAEAGHDENISWDQACDIVGTEVAETARRWTLELYHQACAYAETRGLILADTKFEFGLTDDGLILIDEALTPDSSRYWDAQTYLPGGPQPSFDKQYVRDYLEEIGFNKQPPGPELPEDVVVRTREKYHEAYRLITGRDLQA